MRRKGISERGRRSGQSRTAEHSITQPFRPAIIDGINASVNVPYDGSIIAPMTAALPSPMKLC